MAEKFSQAWWSGHSGVNIEIEPPQDGIISKTYLNIPLEPEKVLEAYRAREARPLWRKALDALPAAIPLASGLVLTCAGFISDDRITAAFGVCVTLVGYALMLTDEIAELRLKVRVQAANTRQLLDTVVLIQRETGHAANIERLD